MPEKFLPLIDNCDGITLHNPIFTREEIHSKFMQNADVLLLPTYVESFGMVVLEALANGLALLATDVYAIGEMVKEGVNGNLISPPISIWDGVLPSATYYNLANIKQIIQSTDVHEFELKIEKSLVRFIADPAWRMQAQQASITLMENRFTC